MLYAYYYAECHELPVQFESVCEHISSRCSVIIYLCVIRLQLVVILALTPAETPWVRSVCWSGTTAHFITALTTRRMYRLQSFLYNVQKRFLKGTELKHLRERWGGGDNVVLRRLRELIQAASKMTFAVRSPSFTDRELARLKRRSRNPVRAKRVQVVHFAGVC